ncbi:MAG: polyprenyl synthetase family protein [Clostridia bacterium]|nr:polyprenyl synthetase family protein [Clostridia bacterium]
MNENFVTLTAEFEERLSVFFQTKKGYYPEKLYQAMEYSLFGGGKRIRPLIMRLSAEFLDVSWSKVVELGIALELIHTYSLIHDDLPSMDNDDLRRGKPTCHKVFGEAMAILAGDALLNLAYETALKAVSLDNKLFSSALLIAESAGACGMIGGQAEDITLCGADEGSMLSMYAKKTAALIKAAALTPCYLHKNEPVYADMETFGEKLGLLFQLTDDLLDMDNHSYPACFGVEKTEQLKNRLSAEIFGVLTKYGEKAQKLAKLVQNVAYRQK